MATNQARRPTVLHIVPSDVAVDDMTFSKGLKITNEATLAAYLGCVFKGLQDDETTLTVPEIIDTWNNVRREHPEAKGDALEDMTVDAMIDRQSGGGDDDSNIGTISSVSAASRVAIATSFGQRLGELGDSLLSSFLAARMTVKKGPVEFMLKVVRTAWTTEERDAMPLPWSKHPTKGATVEASNVQYDIYKTSVGGETKRGSWYQDEILGLTTAQALEENIERVAKLSDQERNKAHVAFKKTEASALNAATNLLRRSMMLDKVLRYIADNMPKLNAEVRVDANGEALSTDYPVYLSQTGDTMGGIMLTLNNLMKAFDPIEGDPLTSRLQAAKAAGGLLEHFKKHVLPKKDKSKNKFPAVTDAEHSFAAMFRLATYFNEAGMSQFTRKLVEPGEVGETYVSIFGDMMSVLLPVWAGTPGLRERYQVIDTGRQTEARKKLVQAFKPNKQQVADSSEAMDEAI